MFLNQNAWYILASLSYEYLIDSDVTFCTRPRLVYLLIGKVSKLPLWQKSVPAYFGKIRQYLGRENKANEI